MHGALRARMRDAGLAWCAVALALLIGSLLAFAFKTDALIEWQPALAATQPWRWWSAAFVHYSALHLVGNLAGLSLTAAFGWVSQVPLRAAIAWFIAWPLTQLGLLCMPGLLHYGGLSGVVHAGVAIVIGYVLITGTRGQRAVVVTVMVGLVTKIATETPWREPVQHPAGWDIGIAPIAHVTGVLAGVLCLLLAQAWHAGQQRKKRRHA